MATASGTAEAYLRSNSIFCVSTESAKEVPVNFTVGILLEALSDLSLTGAFFTLKSCLKEFFGGKAAAVFEF